MTKEAKRIVILPSDELRKSLEDMSKSTNLPMTVLANLALHSLVANYEAKGSFIFADLLNPEHRNKGGK